MTYFLYRLLALSIMTSLLGIGVAVSGAAAAVHAGHIILLISITFGAVGLALTVSRDALAKRLARR